jgi:hypothetical protein
MLEIKTAAATQKAGEVELNVFISLFEAPEPGERAMTAAEGAA